jgi:hypothetical protein
MIPFRRSSKIRASAPGKAGKMAATRGIRQSDKESEEAWTLQNGGGWARWRFCVVTPTWRIYRDEARKCDCREEVVLSQDFTATEVGEIELTWLTAWL